MVVYPRVMLAAPGIPVVVFPVFCAVVTSDKKLRIKGIRELILKFKRHFSIN